MAVIDVYTRELLTLCAYDGWDVDSVWAMRTLAVAMSQSKRRPTAVMHDRAAQFVGQVARQLRVLEASRALSVVELMHELYRATQLGCRAGLQSWASRWRRVRGAGGRGPTIVG